MMILLSVTNFCRYANRFTRMLGEDARCYLVYGRSYSQSLIGVQAGQNPWFRDVSPFQCQPWLSAPDLDTWLQAQQHVQRWLRIAFVCAPMMRFLLSGMIF